MPGVRRRQAAFTLVAVAVLAAAPPDSRAAENDVEASGTPKVIMEWVGLEVTPASYSLTQLESGWGDRSSRLQTGPGWTIRLFRRRWERGYFTPIQAGVYATSGDAVTYAHIEPEFGAVIPGTGRRLELGMGLGLALLSINYASGCDGSCNAGGEGVTVSPVARYLFYTARFAAVGASVRAVIPVVKPIGELVDRWGSALFMGLELGFGRQ